MQRRMLLFTSLVFFTMTTGWAGNNTQKWKLGWDNFKEPIDLARSNIKWSVSSNHELTVTFDLVSATPNKLYQVSINFFCNTFPANFGQFPTDGGGGACQPLTRQHKTKKSAEVELGVVRTDINGNGSLTVVIGPVASGKYVLEFFARDGAGCNVNGGCGTTNCAVDFQSPGPFGHGTTINVP